MRQARNCVFETNSSSTHSITMCMASDDEKWKNGELYWDRWNGKFVSKDDVDKYIEEIRNEFKEYEPDYVQGEPEWDSAFEEYLNDDNPYYSRGRYSSKIGYWYDTYTDRFTTPSGDEVVSFGYYGHD